MAKITTRQVRDILEQELAEAADPSMTSMRVRLARLFDIEPGALQLLFRVQQLVDNGRPMREAVREALGVPLRQAHVD